MRTSVAVLALLSLSPVAPAQPGVAWWHRSWEEAFEEARKRNVPLLVVFIQDGEEANERIVAGLHRDPGFLKLTKAVVPIIANIGVHAPMKQEIRGTTESVCSRFGSITCTRHKEHEMEARQTFFPSGPVITPNHIVVLPEGKETARIHDVHPLGAYESAVREAQKKLGRGLSSDDYAAARKGLEDARRALVDGRPRDVLPALEAVSRTIAGTPLEKEADALRERLETLARAELEAAEAAHKEARVLDALRAIEGAKATFKGTSTHKDLVKLEASIKRTSAGREAAALLAREERARPRFEKGQELEGAREFARAAQEYLRVLRQAPGTPLAATARERLEAFRKDADIADLVKEVVVELEADDALEAASALAGKDRAGYRAKLQEIIERWPGSEAAAKAKRLLERGD